MRSAQSDELDPDPAAHAPVMVEETASVLTRLDEGEPLPEAASFIDCTVGAGGHALAILERLSAARGALAGVLYVGIDRDQSALTLARARLAHLGGKQEFVHGRMSELKTIAAKAGIGAADGILMDLGVSSMQLADPARGFMFRQEAGLDMRMDPDRDLVSARDLVNELDEDTLARIIREFGEERYAGRIARGILYARAQGPISTTSQLASIVARSVPPHARHGRIHVATRTFQALRIAVNDELGELSCGLSAAMELLAPHGRLVVIAFHSLEDRPVKERFKAAASSGEFRLLSRKCRKASDAEIAANPRARSARLRVIERLQGASAA